MLVIYIYIIICRNCREEEKAEELTRSFLRGGGRALLDQSIVRVSSKIL